MQLFMQALWTKIMIDANFNEWNLIHVDLLITNVSPVT